MNALTKVVPRKLDRTRQSAPQVFEALRELIVSPRTIVRDHRAIALALAGKDRGDAESAAPASGRNACLCRRHQASFSGLDCFCVAMNRSRQDRVIGLPVPCPLDLAFDGQARDTLYVTSARQPVSLEVLADAPLSGRLFSFDDAQ